MKKLTKLIGLLGISSSSLFFNPAYSQETVQTLKNNLGYIFELKEDGTVTISDKDGGMSRSATSGKYDPKEYELYKDPNGAVYPRRKGTQNQTSNQNKTQNPNLLKTTQNEWEKAYDKNHNKNTYPSNKTYTPSKNVYIPPKKNEINWDKTMGNAILIGGGILLLNELFKPRNKAPVYNNAPPANNPPTNYNSNPEENIDWWKEKNKNSGGNWWSDEQKQEKPKDGNWWEDGAGETKKTENVNGWEEKTNESYQLKSVKSLEDVLNEQQQKKTESQQRAEKTSKELSDFVEKQAGYSPETKIWFDEEAKKADEFYKEFYKNDPEAYAETQNFDKLHKVIGYNAYKMGKKSPAGPVFEGVEKYDKIKEKGVENYWKEEVKKADEFLKQYESNPELKFVLDEKRLEGIINKDVYIQKIEKDKYSEQINKIAYESDVSKVIRYRAYQYAKNHTEAGTVIKGVEKYEEKKESTGWWDK